jgi:hypothetical protein
MEGWKDGRVEGWKDVEPAWRAPVPRRRGTGDDFAGSVSIEGR